MSSLDTYIEIDGKAKLVRWDVGDLGGREAASLGPSDHGAASLSRRLPQGAPIKFVPAVEVGPNEI